ncbi:hypothetical protein [Acetivibrio straminisolvens]|uniref:Lipoprotein n=1 Tax=Acetivibrio straminisolvens JCM 21531 TaxID=1294263 RepID=W4VBX0_9FIRM|nr:hypothetical protein [Acetivibrio straminisolvens]GAE90288.1 hypothetical protein JCM21531_3883 [Acetivibrio straminisolvens JCM 21531]
MKYKILTIIISIFTIFIIVSCDNNTKNTTANVPDTESTTVNLAIDNFTTDNPLKSEQLISKKDIDEYFSLYYNYFKEQKIENSNYIDSSFFRYSLEFPTVFFYKATLYFANNSERLTPSYIKISVPYEIEALRDFGFKKGMSLNDVNQIDKSLKIEECKISHSDNNISFIELKIDNYIYILTASDSEEEIVDVYIKKEGTNLIDAVYNDITNLIADFSDYDNCYPLFLTRGNINHDSYEDVIITFEIDTPQDGIEAYGNSRVTLILFGSKDGYVKYGEVEGLITSNGGLFGKPIVSTNIDNGTISISQYGGSAWRWNVISTYQYDKTDKRIYLIKQETSNYHNVSPVQDTLQTVVSHFEEKIDILDKPDYQNSQISKTVSKTLGKSTITYEELKYSDNIKQNFINDTIKKYTNKQIEKIKSMGVEGKFSITFGETIKNEKFASICIYTNGNYYDYSKEIENDEYNESFHDEEYVNIDLVNLKEVNIFDYYSIDEIAQKLYDVHVECGNVEDYSVKSKEDIVNVIKDSLNGTNEGNNKFKYYFNDLSVRLVLYLQYKNEDIVHERQCSVLRTDELVVEPILFKEWFNSELQ